MSRSRLRKENTILADTKAAQSENPEIVNLADRITATIIALMNADFYDERMLRLLNEMLESLYEIQANHGLMPKPLHSGQSATWE